MRKIVYLLIGILLCMKLEAKTVHAMEVSVPVLTSDTTETVEKMNIFEEFYYRMFEKDTKKDFFDYVLLAIFIVGLLIVMVFQNTHYVVVERANETILEEEPVEIESIEVEKAPVEVVEAEVVEEPKEKERKKKRE